ncbi:MAG: phosphoketolase family protein [bacterium]|nr:phosphoketolase family protein [bacterium]
MFFWSKAPSIGQIKKYVRAANYLGAAQIYLQDNFFLKEELKFEHIKPRLLGHWGTVPGINFVYAFCNYLIKKHDQKMLFVLGPGHGFPALQANLFLEGTLSKFYKQIPYNEKGMVEIIRKFSWPYGYPSHSNPSAPGVILEGGELGYALSTSFGSVFDNPDLITVCLIGDGEAETGPTATAWHGTKFLDPATCGAVLPILHLNGYKISGPTIFGRMSNDELYHLFTGYGYYPLIVEGKNLYRPMKRAMDKAYEMITAIQKSARKGKKVVSPRWPMIILKSLKGWTGIHKLGEKLLEGNFASHQVIAKNCKQDAEELKFLEKWLRTYQFDKLFSPQKGFSRAVEKVIPPLQLCMGNNKHAFAGKIRKPLRLPRLEKLALRLKSPGAINGNPMITAGDYLKEIFRLNKKTKNFRLMSPDETYSNKLSAVFQETDRAWQWPRKDFDEDMSPHGRVMEMLSEHTLQGFLQGYVLTGRHAIFTSYEAFIQIVSSMVDQYAKFIKASQDIHWRQSVPSLNYILSSLGWRQDHNGYSHQNPGFVSNVLMKHGGFTSVYFPVDVNTMLVTLEDCLNDTDRINIIVSGKNFLPQWLTLDEARTQAKKGIMTWKFASHPNPDIILTSAGDYPTQETLAAVNIIRFILPRVRVRYVNVSELTALGIGDENDSMTKDDFVNFFSKDKPIIFNFHGYPATIKEMFFGHGSGKRVQINGYTEEGSTTTPFDLQVRNNTSRYQLVKQAVGFLMETKKITSKDGKKILGFINKQLMEHIVYVVKHGVDPSSITDWKWGECPQEFKPLCS